MGEGEGGIWKEENRDREREGEKGDKRGRERNKGGKRGEKN